MSITTYSELKTQVAAFLDRDDLTAQIPGFIALAEARIFRDVHHWRGEVRATATFDAQYEEVPPDWIGMVRVSIQNDRPLTLISSDDMTTKRQRDNTAGKPCHYTMTAGQIELYPTPDASYTGEIVYRARPDALTSDNITNWVLEVAPDAYLYGALMQSAPYLSEDQRIAVWGAMYQSAVDGLNTEKNALYTGTGLKKRIS